MEIRNVLLVDDDPHIRKLAKMSLERVGGWQVTAAASGQEAIEMLDKARPDVIILDLMMPGLDGKATLSMIRARANMSAVPVVLMTAKVQSSELDEFLELGAAGVIVKPFDPLKLPDEIRTLLT